MSTSCIAVVKCDSLESPIHSLLCEAAIFKRIMVALRMLAAMLSRISDSVSYPEPWMSYAIAHARRNQRLWQKVPQKLYKNVCFEAIWKIGLALLLGTLFVCMNRGSSFAEPSLRAVRQLSSRRGERVQWACVSDGLFPSWLPSVVKNFAYCIEVVTPTTQRRTASYCTSAVQTILPHSSELRSF